MLDVRIDVERYESRVYGDVPLLDATASYDEESGDLTLFCVNRSIDVPLELRVPLRALPTHRLVEATVLADDDLGAHNTEAKPDRVTPRILTAAMTDEGDLRVELPPVSWTVIRLESGETARFVQSL